MISIPRFSNKIASSFTNAMLMSRNTLAVSFAAFAVLQSGIFIISTPETCAYISETRFVVLVSIPPTSRGNFLKSCNIAPGLAVSGQVAMLKSLPTFNL